MAEGQGRGVDSFLPRDVFTIDATSVKLVDLTELGALSRVGAHGERHRWKMTGPHVRPWAELRTSLDCRASWLPRQQSPGVVLAVFEGKIKADQLRVAGQQPLGPLVD